MGSGWQGRIPRAEQTDFEVRREKQSSLVFRLLHGVLVYKKDDVPKRG